MEDVGFNNGQTIWNNGYNYQNPSFTEDINKGKFASAFGLDQVFGGLWNDITGVTAQSREFAQQEYLQDKQNEYNTPENQMKRMVDAGINPNLAAQGIAGSGSQSAQAPAVSSNTGGAAAGLSAAAGLISGIGSGASGLAAAKETKELLGVKGQLMQAQTIQSLEAAGVDHWTATSIATLLPIQEANAQADFYLKLAQYDNTRAEYQVILDEHQLKLEQIRLAGNQADEAEEKARFAKAETDFFVEHGFRDDAPLDVSLRNAIVTGRKDEAAAVGSAIYSFNYNSAYGQYTADANTAFDRMKNAAEGAAAGNADYQSYLTDLEVYKENVTGFMQMWYALPDSLKGFAVQFLGKELYGVSALLGDVDKKPTFKGRTKIQGDEFSKSRKHGFSGRW